ncbi:hypothetical protein ANCCAN_05948 [Ancylostoma caninum]|uniref:Integrase zinc-binding domain-containing protein n=1 Tax=Ancylostoma caninum TaxID=29170 RepID=A0A368GXE2_ANCCA|nr:hypothetical protein ANCCAN_05948 [Ancylostoma caninum]
MPLELYDNIVEFKRTGSYPPNIGVRHDRSALSHWRARCLRFILADDNETLLYYNPSSSVNDQPKVVVKKGEVHRVIERIHDLIGHLGQKRTQIVVLKKLHWRSVRQDVKTFINSCAFCNQKKLEGKKILKAPVDVTSDNFDINVEVRNKTLANGEIYDRFNFTLIGYNEQEVRAAAVTRMTSYTFKETASELRGRFSRPGSGSNATNFRRQPYIKRTRYSPYASGFIVPYAGKHKNDEPGFIEVFQDERDPTLSSTYNGHVYPVEELTENQSVNETSDEQHNIAASISRVPTKTEVGTITASQIPSSSKRENITTPRLATFNGGRQKKASKTSNLGLATRFSLAMGENADRAESCDNAELLLPSYDTFQSRPEMSSLPPIMLMPSSDPEVIHMQKELLLRQLRLQRIQEKVLQAQFNSLRLPIARYEEIDPDGGQVQLLGEDGDEFIGERVDEDQELNVMNSGDESDEIMRESPS